MHISCKYSKVALEVAMTGSQPAEAVIVGAGPLTAADVVAVARYGAQVRLASEGMAEVRRSREIVESLADDTEPHYGISTGFGALATRHIPADLRAQLQASLVRSHAAGSGPDIEGEVVRALMLLRLATLATGRTGAREETVQAYAALLNSGFTPVVHEYGSLGCSGDLAPLAHCALAITGEGVVRDGSGRTLPAAEALAAARIKPVRLREKEGLALINGTDGMLGMLVLAIADTSELLKVADITAAMSVEALLGTDAAFAGDLQALRPHPGQAVSAANLRAMLAGSGIMASHRGPECTRVQDAYSLRCAPQVAGAVADLASMSERRTDRFLDVARNQGLPAFLADDPGVDSGHMIAQYTQAAIVSELKRLAVPASVDSIPSSAMQEDHVSMGWSAARKLRRALDGLTRVLAIELLTAARGIELRAPLAPSAATGAVVAGLRAGAAGPGPDRFLAPEIEAAVRYVADGRALRAAEAVTGPLS